MYVITHLSDLKSFLCTHRHFHIYSAGFAASNFLMSLDACGIEYTIKSVLVTKKDGNPDTFWGAPVIQYDTAVLTNEDCILLTVSERFKQEIIDCLKDCKAELVFPSIAIFYNDVYRTIKPFVDCFSTDSTDLNKPVPNSEKTVWTCWWQGEDRAPELIKACWKSQRKYLTDDVRHIIITKDNYTEYITIPDHIMELFKNKKISYPHLADFIRACLLYKYGGVWLDATVLLVDMLPEDCWNLPLYTWMFDNNHFSSKTIWATWFLASQKGNILYRFVMEAFLYYFSIYDQLKYYYTMDYFISICTNQVDGVLEMFKQIPYNNEKATLLGMHLHDPYSEDTFLEYCEGSFLQKLSRHGGDYRKDSIHNYIIKKYCCEPLTAGNGIRTVPS